MKLTARSKAALCLFCCGCMSQAWAISDAIANSYPPIVQGQVKALAVDSAGNRYVTGVFTGNVDFNPGSGLDSKTSAGSQDAFITRFNADGTYGWTQTFGSSAPDQGNAIALSADELTVYVAGPFTGPDARIGGAGPIVAASGSDAFIIALDAGTGAARTAFGLFSSGIQKFGGSGTDTAFGLAVSGTTVYAVGNFASANAQIGATGPSVSPIALDDVFIIALDGTTGAAKTAFGLASSGIQTFGGTAIDNARGIAVGGGTVYVTGQFASGTVQIGAAGSQVPTSGAGDAYVLALDAVTGAAKTAFGLNSSGIQKFGGTNDDQGTAVAFSGTTVYVAGYYNSTNATVGGTGPQLTSSNYDTFVMALDATSGAAQTAFGVSSSGVQTFGGTNSDQATGIAVDTALARVYVTGSFLSSNARIAGTVPSIAAVGNADAFVIALDSTSGAKQTSFGLSSSGIQIFGGSGNDAANAVAVRGTLLYIAGEVSSFDAGIGGIGPSDGTGFGGFVQLLPSSTGANNAPQITSPLTANGQVGAAFNYTITCTNTPTSFTATNLPASLTHTNGVISGTLPAVGGLYNINISAANIFGVGKAALALTVVADAVAVEYPPIVQGQVNGVAVDSAGNKYLVGSFNFVLDFKPVPGFDIKASAGQSDVFITRYNADGSYAWTQTFGGSNNDSGNAILVSPDDQTVYVVGTFSGSDARIGGAGPAVAAAVTGSGDAFVIALDASNGAARTAFGLSSSGIQKFGGGNNESGLGLAMAGTTLFVCGTFNSVAQIGGAGPTVSPTGSDDGFIIALNATTGAAVTSFGLSASGIQKIAGSANETAKSMAVVGSTLYVTGQFSSANLTIGGTGGQVATTGAGDAYVAALDVVNGTAKTAFGLASSGIQKFGGTQDDFGAAITTNGSTLYVAGSFLSANAAVGGAGPTLATAGNYDVFVLALDGTTGAPLTSFGILSSGVQTFGGNAAEQVSDITLKGSTLYVAGNFASPDAKIGGVAPTVGTSGSLDAYVIAIDLATGAAKTNFGLSSSGIQKFGGSGVDSAAGGRVSGTVLYLTGFSGSFNNGVGGLGTYDATGFGGFLQALDTVTGAQNLPQIISSLTAFGQSGTNFNYQIAATNSPTTFNATNLPGGLSVNGSGLITGTLPGPGSYNINLSATNLFGTGKTVLVLKTLADAVTATYPPIIQGGDSGVAAIAFDANGNRYVLGTFSAQTDFNPVAGFDPKTPAGSSDIFVTRFNANGSYAWTQTFGGSSNESAGSITVSTDGASVYATGFFGSTNARIGGAGQSVLPSGTFDAFVIALDAATGAAKAGFGIAGSGIQTFGGTGNETARGVAATGSALYVTGSFNSSDAKIGGAGPTVASTTSANDAFIIALDPATGAAKTNFGLASSGIQKIGGLTGDIGSALLVDSGTLYVVGQITSSDTAIGGAGPTVGSNGFGDAFVAALDATTGAAKTSFGRSSSGIQTFGGTSDDIGTDIAILGSTLYATGYFVGSARIGLGTTVAAAGQSDAFVIALDSTTGAAKTTFGLASTGIQTFGGANIDQARAMTVSGSTLYVAGEFTSNDAKIGGTGPAVGMTNYDAFVIALDANTGAAKTAFGTASSGIQTFGGTMLDEGFAVALSGSTLYLGGKVLSANAGIGGTGAFDGTGFLGFLLPLDPATGGVQGAAPPQITSPLTASGIPGASFNYQITATNSPTSFNATNLPAGLNVASGLITGTLPAVGSYNITLSATNASGTGNATLVLTVINDAIANTYPPIVQGGTNGIIGLAIDSSGNRYVTGHFNSTLDFNPGVGVDGKSAVGFSDVFVTRFNANGSYAWTQTFGGAQFEVASAIAVSADGSTVYVAGSFDSPDAKIGGAGPAIGTAGLLDAFVIALDSSTGAAKTSFGRSSSGIQTFGGSSDDEGHEVAVSGSTVYVTGEFSSAAAKIGNSGPAVATSGVQDGYVIALDALTGAAKTSFGVSSSGIQKLGGTAADSGSGVAVSGSTIYITGSFSSSDLKVGGAGPAVGVVGLTNAFVIALDAASGAAKTSFGLSSSGIQTFGADIDMGIAVAASASTVYVAGYFNSAGAKIGGVGPAVGTAGSFDAFVIALDASSGAAKSSFGVSSSGIQTFGGSGLDQGSRVALNGSTVYVTGLFSSTNAKIGAAGPAISAGADFDAFAIALDAASGAAKSTFGITSSGIQTFGGSLSDKGFAQALSGSALYLAGLTLSQDSGVGGAGTFDNTGFNGFLLELNATTGQAPPLITPQITSPLTASGIPGASFNYQITAVNAPTSYNAANLPGGLTVTNGLISGTLPGVGTYNIPLSATNAAGTGNATLVLTVINDAVANKFPPIVQGIDNGIVAMAVDSAGNQYLLGDFSGRVDFNPGVGLDGKSAASGDVFITRYNANGSYAWTQTFGSASFEAAGAIAVSPDGLTVYATGQFTGTVKIGGGGPGVNPTAALTDAFVIALDTATGAAKAGFGIAGSGIQIFGGSGNHDGRGIAVNSSGLYVTGSFDSSDAKIGGSGPSVAASSGGVKDAFIIALDPATGAAQTGFGLNASGIQKFGGTAGEIGNGVLLSGSSVYVVGRFASTNAQIGGAGPTVAAVGSNDAFVIALDTVTGAAKTSFGLFSSGIQRIGGLGDDNGTALVILGSNLYVTGYFNVDVRIGTGPSVNVISNTDAFVAALNASSGAAQSSFGVSASGIQVFAGNGVDKANSVAVQGTTVYVAGEFSGNDARLATGGATVVAQNIDAFVLALDSSSGAGKPSFGIPLSGVQTFGGTGIDEGFAVAVSGSTVYLAGFAASNNARAGMTGPFDGTGFRGFVLPLDAAAGVVPNAPQITSPLAAAGFPGAAFNYQITATNSPTSFNATNLPGGLTVNNGLISGTLPAAGTYNINLSAANAAWTGTAVLVLNVINDAVATTYPPIVQGGDIGVLAVAVDAAGNRYVGGSFSGPLDFNPGVGADVKVPAGVNDAFITRYNADGSYAWTQTFGGLDESVRGLSVSPDGSTVYATGDFSGANARIGGVGFSVSATNSGFYDVFVIALNAATGAPKPGFGLNASGIQKFGGSNNDQAKGIAVSPDGATVYITGSMVSSDAAVGGGGAQVSATNATRDAFVLALDSNSGAAKTSFGIGGSGVQTFGGPGNDVGSGVVVLGSSVYVAGGFSNTARIGGAGPTVTAPNSFGDGFVIALDSSTGAAKTTFGVASSGIQTIGGSSNDNATALAALGTTLYVTGFFNSNDAKIGGTGPGVAVSAFGTNVFVAALDATTGVAQTAFGVLSSGLQKFGGNNSGGTGYAVTAKGTTVYVAGSFGGTDATIGGAGPAIGALGGPGVQDAFVLALDTTSGAAKSSFGILSSGIQTYGGTGDDQGYGVAVSGTTLFVGGNVTSTDAGVGAVAGTFSGTGFKGYLLPLDPATGQFGAAQNNAPTDITLSNSSIDELMAAGSSVGTFSTSDPDAGNTFTYTLVSGAGSTDNASFTIAGAVLQTAAVFDFEAKSSYSIRVRSTDQGGLPFEKAFIINVGDVNEAPTDIALSNSTIPDKSPAGTAIGDFSTADPDAGNTFTYALVAGAGGDDNLSFTVTGTTLQNTDPVDFNAKSSFSIRVRSTDQGGQSFEKAFALTVVPLTPSAAPVIVSLTSDQDPAFLNSLITFTLMATDADSATLHGTVDFGDGKPAVTKPFPANTAVDFTNDYAFPGDFTVTARVSDGITSTPPFTFIQHVPSPASGAAGVPNIAQNDDPIVNPSNGLSIRVMSSNGGVVQLGIDVDSFTEARANLLFSVSTNFGDIAGRSAIVPGFFPVHQYIRHGIFVAKSSAIRRTTGLLAGIGRKTLIISRKETGEQETIATAASPARDVLGDAPSSSIATRALKGKFIFSAAKNDVVSYSGTILLPSGLDTSKPHEFSVGIGNIVTDTMVDSRGKGTLPGSPAILKKLKVTYLKVKRGAITKGGETARIDVLFNLAGMVAAGFDTEGIARTGTGATTRNPIPRNIQIAMLLDGVPYEALAPVLFSVSTKADFGTISGRR